MSHNGPQIELESMSGPHMATFVAHADRATHIGRAATSDVCLQHEGVSRKHAMIVLRSGEWFVVDHGSRLGTFLNGVKLEPSKPARLAPGDLLRIGPWTFRARDVGVAAGGPNTVDDTHSTASRVERVGLVQSRSDKRLRLLADCLAKLAAATEEQALARAALESALEGSGFPRGAVLRRMGGGDEVQVVESVRRDVLDTGQFAFSRSLVRRAAAGETGVLTVDRHAVLGGPVQHSIAELRIHSAMCAPVFLGTSVEGFLYLDARGQEESVNAEASGFCETVARAYGLAIANLKRIELQARHQTLERDLQAAREAQQVMLPPPEGRCGAIAYAMQMRPGLFVAGDMFDVVELPEGRVAVSVGDVAGHGIGSAMLMALAQSYLHAQLVATADASAAVTSVNRFVAERSTAGRFASLWVGVFSRTRDGWRVEYVDAGHGHWLLADGGSASAITTPGSIPIGIDPERRFNAESLVLRPSSRLVLYSDGIVEQRNAAGDEFGRSALVAALAGQSSAPADVQAVFSAMDAFSGGSNVDDDATVASVQLAE